jgi:ABC-type polysaccharide/polyol phosphate transport system ATPase subunit
MSSEVSLRARGLQKRYNLYDTSLGALIGLMTGREASNHHWALRDFDLDAKAGDFIGIVGRNGAGKSTLLQILAGIMTPDSGSLTVNGRVAALLELETGFSPDFTGWENVELSAALYGLSGKQIRQRLPAIAEFAGIGDFMDRPAREYSSGMLAKLAFSVCLHVDAEIVIVDELFGVGDFRFRQRATRRLQQFSEDGIVFFVSHSEATVLSLCNRAIFIEDGRKLRDGSTKSVFRAYQRVMSMLGGETDTFSESGVESEDAFAGADENRSSEGRGISGSLPEPESFREHRRRDLLDQALLTLWNCDLARTARTLFSRAVNVWCCAFGRRKSICPMFISPFSSRMLSGKPSAPAIPRTSPPASQRRSASFFWRRVRFSFAPFSDRRLCV